LGAAAGRSPRVLVARGGMTAAARRKMLAASSASRNPEVSACGLGVCALSSSLDEAVANATEALELYVEGLREEGRALDTGVIRRKFPLPA
jgi:hypothetical protein